MAFLLSNKKLIRPAIIWIAICLIMGLGLMAIAFTQFSFEALYAAIACGVLALTPILLVILGCTIQMAITIRRGLMFTCIVAAILLGIYFLAQGIRQSNTQIDATGAIDLVKDPNFTRTLVTLIICIAILVGLIPVIRLLMRGTDHFGKVSQYNAESRRTIAQQTSENETSVKIRQLENERDIALRQLEIEHHKVNIEAKHQELLGPSSIPALPPGSGQGVTDPSSAPGTPQDAQSSAQSTRSTFAPPPPPPPPPYGKGRS